MKSKRGVFFVLYISFIYKNIIKLFVVPPLLTGSILSIELTTIIELSMKTVQCKKDPPIEKGIQDQLVDLLAKSEGI